MSRSFYLVSPLKRKFVDLGKGDWSELYDVKSEEGVRSYLFSRISPTYPEHLHNGDFFYQWAKELWTFFSENPEAVLLDDIAFSKKYLNNPGRNRGPKDRIFLTPYVYERTVLTPQKDSKRSTEKTIRPKVPSMYSKLMKLSRDQLQEFANLHQVELCCDTSNHNAIQWVEIKYSFYQKDNQTRVLHNLPFKAEVQFTDSIMPKKPWHWPYPRKLDQPVFWRNSEDPYWCAGHYAGRGRVFADGGTSFTSKGNEKHRSYIVAANPDDLYEEPSEEFVPDYRAWTTDFEYDFGDPLEYAKKEK